MAWKQWHLTWKPKWREVHGQYHCFVTDRRGGFESLCTRHRRKRAGGGRIARPPAPLRCAMCDIGEMGLAGVEESLPESPDWSD